MLGGGVVTGISACSVGYLMKRPTNDEERLGSVAKGINTAGVKSTEQGFAITVGRQFRSENQRGPKLLTVFGVPVLRNCP